MNDEKIFTTIDKNTDEVLLGIKKASDKIAGIVA